MVNVRREQIEVFEQAAVRNFEDRMVEHLREFASAHFKVLTEADVRRCVRHGSERAQAHGLSSERSLRIYVQTMFMLGSGFDADPQYPWAAEALGDKDSLGEIERADRLHEKSWDYAARVAEDYRALMADADQKRLAEELRSLRHERDEALIASDLPAFYARTIARMKTLFPRKSEYVGEVSLRRLIGQAVESAKRYGITTERGAAVFVSLMFALGSGFDADPQLPWASAVLKDESITDQRARVDRLYSAAIDCLRRWWA